MAHLRIHENPRLRSPVFIAAFAGWNDASEVATFAARYLSLHWGARKLAEIDAEEFFVFTETRPHVHVAGQYQRRIEWPANEVFYHQDPDGERDYLLMIGTEPQLRWRTFASTVLSLGKQFNAAMLLTLGGLIADVPHTTPVRLAGSGSSARLTQRLRAVGVESSRYEGPTGIVGVLNHTFAKARIPAASIWGNVPDYLSASPNPKVALAILDRVCRLLDLSIDLSDLRKLETQFHQQVNEALAENPEVQAYVHQLEEKEVAGREVRGNEGGSEGESLPSGEALISELEEFLRRRRRGQGGSQSS